MPASRSNRRDLLIWAACATPALLLLVHAMGIVALGWETRSLGSFAPLEGPAYQAPLGSRWMSQELTGDSPARVLEDGRPLAHANAEIDQIVKKGGGRYALRFGALYFSTSDGSDPRTNGRRYELAWPVQPPLALGGGLLLLGLAATMVLLARHRSEIAAAVRQPAYWWSAAVYLAIAGLGRLWFFLEFRVPGLYGDSTSYYAIVQAMDHGHWPEFGIRTPGYPLLLKLIFALSNTVMAVIVVQNLLAIAAALTMIYAFHVYRRSLSLWAAIGMGVYTIGLWTFDSDTALLSDGPYANAIVLALALLMLGVLRRRPRDLAWSSAAIAMAILFRPAGFFLLVIYAISLAFVLWNRFGRRACLALAWPLPAIMLLLCCYNYATMGAFSPTAFGESQIGFATFTFWEQDPSYPANINDAIARTQAVMRKQVSDEGRALMRTSWDFSKLSQVYLGGFHYPALDQASTIDGKNDYFAAREWVQKISFDSIAKHPGFYLKMILTQLWLQYVNNPRYQEDFISFVRNRIDDLYVSDRFLPGKGQPFYVEMAKEWAVRPALPGFRVDREGDATEVVVRQTSLLRRLDRYVVFVRRTVFGNSLWTVLFAIALVVSTARLLRSRCRDVSAFIGFILTISVVGASLVVALVEYGAYRYSAVMEFVYYLPVLPLIFSSPDIRQAAHD